jgi:hypothetical protein
MEVAKYGRNYHEHLLQQVRADVQMADQELSRSHSDQFYISVPFGTAVVVALVGRSKRIRWQAIRKRKVS